MQTFPAQIAYAKNAEHERFLRAFDGKLKGRYHTAFLVSIEFIGGSDLRRNVEAALGHPTYLGDEWYSARDLIVMFDLAVRAGVLPERIGALVTPTHKRAHPELYEGKTVRDVVALLESGYRLDTTYGGVSPGSLVDSKRMLVYRKGSPTPCEHFTGVIKGTLGVVSAQGTVHEIGCQWNGAPACCYEVLLGGEN